MMKFLRTASRGRLLATLAGMVVVVFGGTAIAVAAAGSGPVPPAKPLAQAIHDGLAAPPVQGITADISFTNHLIPASNLGGSNPILSGATGRMWLSADHRLRLELQSANGDAQVVLNGSSFWVYEPSSKTVYEGSLPAGAGKREQPHKDHGLPTVAQIQSELNRLAAHLNLSGAQPSDVAGQAAYTVRVSPRHDGGLLGAAEVAWDSGHGVPLRFAVYAQNSAAPVLELKATNISFGPLAASTFAIAPPSGAKVVTVQTRGVGGRGHGYVKGRARHREITGTAAVTRALPFALEAPGQLVGLPRRSVKLLDWGGHPAALVTYGQNLGGIAVIEQSAAQARTPANPSAGADKRSGSGERRQGLNLPTVSVNGVTGQELDTALGTMVRFARGGVTFTVIGSVPPAAADAAARGL